MLTAYERLTAEIQVRGGRLRETLNDPEPLFHLRNVSAEPLVPGAVPLNGVPEGLFNKNLIGGIRTIEPEPPPPDLVAGDDPALRDVPGGQLHGDRRGRVSQGRNRTEHAHRDPA